MCFNNRFYGLVTVNSNHSIIQNNTCNFNGLNGFTVSNSENTTILDNTCNFNKGYGGINIQIARNIIVKNNTCNYNTNRGLANSVNVYNITYSNNTCNGNRFGIDIYAALLTLEYNTVLDNMINGIRIGAFYALEGNNTIHHNLIANNSQHGVILLGAHNFTVHHNAFIDNYVGHISQAYDGGVNNIWYDELSMEGNYWSDWISGTYLIDGTAGSFDLYPLPSNPL
jgi:parallel beta-helix repeat protein